MGDILVREREKFLCFLYFVCDFCVVVVLIVGVFEFCFWVFFDEIVFCVLECYGS